MIGMQALVHREWLLFFRSKLDIVFTTIPPLIYLLFFTLNFAGLVDSVNGISYVEFVLPGIAILTTMLSSSNAASRAFNEGFSPVVTELMTFPASRTAYVTAKLLAATSLGTFQGTVFLVAGLLIFRSNFDLSNIFFGILVVALTALCTSGIMLTIALTNRDFSLFLILNNIVVQILIWTSSIFYPVEAMFGPLQTAGAINPLSFGSNVLRGLLIPSSALKTSDLVTLLLLALISGASAAFLLARRVGKSV